LRKSATSPFDDTACSCRAAATASPFPRRRRSSRARTDLVDFPADRRSPLGGLFAIASDLTHGDVVLRDGCHGLAGRGLNGCDLTCELLVGLRGEARFCIERAKTSRLASAILPISNLRGGNLR
jgi:hypothetical protein